METGKQAYSDLLLNSAGAVREQDDRITELQGVIAELRSCLKITIEWADKWDCPFMEDAEWTGHYYPRIKAILKRS